MTAAWRFGCKFPDGGLLRGIESILKSTKKWRNRRLQIRTTGASLYRYTNCILTGLVVWVWFGLACVCMIFFPIQSVRPVHPIYSKEFWPWVSKTVRGHATGDWSECCYYPISWIRPSVDRWYVHYAHGRAYCSLSTNEFSTEGLRAHGSSLGENRASKYTKNHLFHCRISTLL